MEELAQGFKDKPVSDWGEIIDTAEYPHEYMMTFAAMISLVFGLCFPWPVTVFLIDKLAYALIPRANADFIVDSYLPELRAATESISLSTKTKRTLLAKFTGMLMKIIWAFLWQEKFVNFPILYHPVTLSLGAALTPHWNGLSTWLSGFAQTDASINEMKNVYPGDSHCRTFSPHSLWHEESANGLLEIAFLADYIYSIL